MQRQDRKIDDNEDEVQTLSANFDVNAFGYLCIKIAKQDE